MTVSEHQFVSFERPPVEEVAFGIQFVDPVIDIEVLAQLTRELHDRFPVRQRQPTLPRMAEPAGSNPVSMHVGFGVELPRIWFVSDDGHRIVQTQEDRLVFNWRRLGHPVEYPRYASLRGEVVSLVEQVQELVPETENLAVDFCELVYVNHLRVEPVGDPRSVPLDGALRTCSSLADSSFLSPPDNSSWSGRWTMKQDDVLLGRLHAAAEPIVLSASELPIYVLTMTARMPTSPVSLADALLLLDMGHEWIVRGFADLTTNALQAEWQRSQ